MSGAMSAFGTKRTSPSALHMSAFGGKADIISRFATIILNYLNKYMIPKLTPLTD